MNNETTIPLRSNFFTNRDGNTLMKEFEGILTNNPQVKNLDAVVGFLRASGYFTLRPFLDGINKARVLIGEVKYNNMGIIIMILICWYIGGLLLKK